MDYKQLRCFVAAAELGSFRAASEQLHLAQSGLSRHIGNMEQELGVQLFERVGRSVRLTDTGGRALPRARRLIKEMDDFVADLRGPRGELRRRVRVRATGIIGSALLSGVEERLHRTHPEVQLRIIDGFHSETVDDVVAGRVDLGIVSRLEHDPRLEVFARFDDDLYVLSARGSAPLGVECELDQLLQLPLVGPPEGSQERNFLEQLARDRGLVLDAVEADTAAMLGLVRRGRGHTVITGIAVGEFPAEENWAVSRVRDLSQHWSLIRRRGSPLNSAEAVVRDALLAELRALGVEV